MSEGAAAVRWARIILTLAVVAGCYYPPPHHDVQPYDSCVGGDFCLGGLACAFTTLPASSGFSGAFCTTTCSVDADCIQVPTGFAALCVNSQCYLSCPSSEACPFDQGCFTFQDQTGAFLNLCTP